MPKKTIDDFDDLLGYYHSYVASALTMLKQVGSKPKFITGLKVDNGYILAAHFLMGHGIELMLKICINLFGASVPTDNKSHDLQSLLAKLELLYKKHYRGPIFNKKHKNLIEYLNRTTKFRYPRDKEWNQIPDILNESKKWSAKKAEKNFNKWNNLKDKLNDLGYRIATKENYS